MLTPTLVIGSKRFSTWSLRPWLILKMAGVAFSEVLIPLRQPDTKASILQHSPSGKVPLLKDGDVHIWDSLAIAEYLAEQLPGLWPAGADARAMARAITAEMHSGFPLLRQTMPMSLADDRLPTPEISPELQAEINRILTLWQDARRRFGQNGPFLFGTWSIADAFFAPVVTRFNTYGVDVPEDAAAYIRIILSLPAMQDWISAAKAEQ